METPVRKFTKNIGKSLYQLASKAHLYISGLRINSAWIEQMKGAAVVPLFIFAQPVLSSFDNWVPPRLGYASCKPDGQRSLWPRQYCRVSFPSLLTANWL
jgi:hypothetical protein